MTVHVAIRRQVGENQTLRGRDPNADGQCRLKKSQEMADGETRGEITVL
jgi:hypothetical protein